MNSAGAAIPPLDALAVMHRHSNALDALGGAVSTGIALNSRIEGHLGFAPLATKLAELSAALDRVEPKRRRAVCKLGRGAANRAHVLAALDRLSVGALEELLDGCLSSDWPEQTFPALERVAWYRSAIREWQRVELAELQRREVRHRAGSRTRSDRKPREPRTLSRPVGSHAPPRPLPSPMSLPRGRTPM
jgi:hypothetical protein